MHGVLISTEEVSQAQESQKLLRFTCTDILQTMGLPYVSPFLRSLARRQEGPVIVGKLQPYTLNRKPHTS